jgi:hypothetical protein
MYPFESDFDNFAALTGDASWKDDKMRGYFKKLEKTNQFFRTPFSHGNNGWMSTTQADLRNLVQPLDAQLLGVAAAIIADIKPTPWGDINGAGSMSTEGWHLRMYRFWFCFHSPSPQPQALFLSYFVHRNFFFFFFWC